MDRIGTDLSEDIPDVGGGVPPRGTVVSASGAISDRFQIEEHRILRGEIELRSREGRSMERNVMLVSAAVYGFLLTPKDGVIGDPYHHLAWYFPPVFNFLAMIRWRESARMIAKLARLYRASRAGAHGERLGS